MAIKPGICHQQGPRHTQLPALARQLQRTAHTVDDPRDRIEFEALHAIAPYIVRMTLPRARRSIIQLKAVLILLDRETVGHHRADLAAGKQLPQFFDVLAG